jgi:hypothetical protein
LALLLIPAIESNMVDTVDPQVLRAIRLHVVNRSLFVDYFELRHVALPKEID